MAGYSLVQHTGEFFEYLPEEVAPIRDTYLVYRDAQIEERGVQTNAIWEAIPAISKASGLGFYELAREMRRLSIKLILEHPDLYLRNVIEGWIDFWKAPVYWAPESLHSHGIRSLFSGLSIIGRMISIGANIAFLFISGLGLIHKRSRVVMGFDQHTVVAGGLVWILSILQTMVDHGDNPRFLVPLQMVVIYVVVRSIWYWIISRAEAM
jgi:hypothetical protein